LIKVLRIEAQRRGIKKFSFHSRVQSGLSHILQKRYKAKFLRRIENWRNFEEPFDYLEIDSEE